MGGQTTVRGRVARPFPLYLPFVLPFPFPLTVSLISAFVLIYLLSVPDASALSSSIAHARLPLSRLLSPPAVSPIFINSLILAIYFPAAVSYLRLIPIFFSRLYLPTFHHLPYIPTVLLSSSPSLPCFCLSSFDSYFLFSHLYLQLTPTSIPSTPHSIFYFCHYLLSFSYLQLYLPIFLLHLILSSISSSSVDKRW